jgi:hypothetical protein
MEPIPLFRSSGVPGFSAEFDADPRRVLARKREREIPVEFAAATCDVDTPEGVVRAKAGDAILTGTEGERWPVSRAKFFRKYRPKPPTLAGAAGLYVSLPGRIHALSMDRPFEVLLADGVSRLHGTAGDWLVDYGDGSLGIVARAIFAKTYEIVG